MPASDGLPVNTQDRALLDLDTRTQEALWNFEDKVRGKMPQEADTFIRHVSQLAIEKRLTADDINTLASPDGLKAIEDGQKAAKDVPSEHKGADGKTNFTTAEGDPKAVAEHVAQFDDSMKKLHIEEKAADPNRKPEDTQKEVDDFMRVSHLPDGTKAGRALTGFEEALAGDKTISADNAQKVLAVAENKLENAKLSVKQIDELAGADGIKHLEGELGKNAGHVRIAMMNALDETEGRTPTRRSGQERPDDNTEQGNATERQEAYNAVPGNPHAAIHHQHHHRHHHGHGQHAHPGQHEKSKGDDERKKLDGELSVELEKYNGAAIAANSKPLSEKQISAIESRVHKESLSQGREELSKLKNINEVVLGQEQSIRNEQWEMNKLPSERARANMDGDKARAGEIQGQEKSDGQKIKVDQEHLKSLIKKEDLALLKGLSMQHVQGGNGNNFSPSHAGGPDTSPDIKR